jgi:hypothetical protein
MLRRRAMMRVASARDPHAARAGRCALQSCTGAEIRSAAGVSAHFASSY